MPASDGQRKSNGYLKKTDEGAIMARRVDVVLIQKGEVKNSGREMFGIVKAPESDCWSVVS